MTVKSNKKKVSTAPNKADLENGPPKGMVADGTAAMGKSVSKAGGGGGKAGKGGGAGGAAKDADPGGTRGGGGKGTGGNGPDGNTKATDTGDPIEVFTGDVVDTVQDLFIAAPQATGRTTLDPDLDGLKQGNGGWAFEWCREYRSGRSAERLPFGPGWTHNYDEYLQETPEGIVHWSAKGRFTHFGHALDELQGEGFVRGQRLRAQRYGDVIQITALETGVIRTFQREPEKVRLEQAKLTRLGDPNHERAWRLESITDRRGNGIELKYTEHPAGSRLMFVQDRRGWRFRVDYTRSRICAVTLERVGQTPREPAQPIAAVRYHYHPRTRELAAVQDADGGVSVYEYDGAHRLVHSVSPLGAHARWSYDDFSRCVRAEVDDGQYKRRLQYVAWDNVVVTGFGVSHIYTFGSRGQLLNVKATDQNYQQTFTYDDDLYVTSETDGCGNTRTFEYDWQGNKTREVDPAGNATTWQRFKNYTSISHSDGHFKEAWYDDFGDLIRVRERGGEDRYYGRDRLGRIDTIHARAAHSETDRGALIERRYYDENGLLKYREDARGLRTSYEHDALGYVIARTDTFGDGSATRRWTYKHDAFGRVLEQTFPDGTRETFQYLPAGLVKESTDRNGATTRSEYSRTGKLLRRVEPDHVAWNYRWTAEDQLESIENDALGHHDFQYDLAGRLTQEITFDGRWIKYAYNAAGHLTRIERASNDFRTFQSDPLGNVLEERASDGAVLSYKRDTHGRVLEASVEDEYGAIVTHFERDTLGRVVCERIGPTDDLAIRWSYDGRGRVASRTVLGERTEYEYDHAGDVRAVIHTPKNAAPVRTEITRNVDGLEVQRTATQLSDGVGSQVHQTAAGANLAINSHYTAFGQLERRQVVVRDGGAALPPQAGTCIPYLESVEAGWTAPSDRRFQYDACQRLTQTVDRTWGLSRYQYSEAGRLEIAEREKYVEYFAHDAAGGLKARCPSFDGEIAYGKPEQPAAEYAPNAAAPPPPSPPHPSALSFTSDAFVHKRPGGRVTKYGEFEYDFDGFGRRTRQRHQETGAEVLFTWDARDQLRVVKRSDGYVVVYDYDAFGRRVRKRIGHPPPSKEQLLPIFGALFEEDSNAKLSEMEPFLTESQLALIWDGDELCAEQFGQVWHRVHVHVPDQRLTGAEAQPSFTPFLQSQDGVVLQVVTDHLGTPKELVDTCGNVLWSAAHTAFGEVLETWHPTELTAQNPLESPFRLKGQYYDSETELCSTRHRYFDANCGHWLSADPIGTAGGYRLFEFNGEPTVVSDPLGLSPPKKNETSEQPAVKPPEETKLKNGLTRVEDAAPPTARLSNEQPMPPGTRRVQYKDESGRVQAVHYVDADGRTIRSETRINSADTYEKGSRPTPKGMQPGDDRGHLGPERHMEDQRAANVPENVLPEHKQSNTGPKKRWENRVPGWSDDAGGDCWTVHEPQYAGSDARPTGSKHWVEKDGETVPGTESGVIPNDKTAPDYNLPWETDADRQNRQKAAAQRAKKKKT